MLSVTEKPVTPQEVKAFFEAKERRRQEFLDTRFAQAHADFARILDLIIREYCPLRVWQWGSLLDRTRFSEISDIDIAVEGAFSPQVFFDMYGRTMELTSFPLDLVDIDSIEAAHAQSIRENGRLAFERD